MYLSKSYFAYTDNVLQISIRNILNNLNKIETNANKKKTKRKWKNSNILIKKAKLLNDTLIYVLFCRK